jgi:integrase
MLYRELLGLDMKGDELPDVKAADTWRGWRLDIARNWHAAVVALRNRKLDAGRDKATGNLYAAQNVFGAVRTMFKWAAGEGIDIAGKVSFEVNAIPGLKKKRRERHLSDAEIPAFFAALDACDMERNLKRLARWLLLTGGRTGEGRELHAREIDRAKGTWTLPAERAKNGRELVLPLTPAMLAVLDEAAPVDGWVFWSQRTNAPYGDQALHIAVGRMRKKYMPDVPPFRPHDFRHTVLTGLDNLGVDEIDRDRIANHFKGSVSDRYTHAQRLEFKRAALLKWHDHLAALCAPPSGDNVVRLHG